MSSRGRIRVGREVSYFPTAAEETALGAGPWPAKIVAVNADGTVELATQPPGQSTVGAALASPLVTTPDANANGAGYVQADVVSIETLANANKVAINALVARLNQLVTVAGEARKSSVAQGGVTGRYALVGDPAAL